MCTVYIHCTCTNISVVCVGVFVCVYVFCMSTSICECVQLCVELFNENNQKIYKLYCCAFSFFQSPVTSNLHLIWNIVFWIEYTYYSPYLHVIEWSSLFTYMSNWWVDLQNPICFKLSAHTLQEILKWWNLDISQNIISVSIDNGIAPLAGYFC